MQGKLEEYVSTAFQPAPWQSAFFDAHPEEAQPDASALVSLGPHHTLVQLYDSPWNGQQWDFSEADSIIKPLLALGLDPVVQIAPPTTGNSAWFPPMADPPDPGYTPEFANYCATIVRYYNTAGGISPDGGIPADGGPALQWSNRHIQSWAIWSDPNTKDFSPVLDSNAGSDFGLFYSAAAAAMRSVDPAISLLGPEFNDCIDNEATGTQQLDCTPDQFIPTFLQATADGGADGGMAPIDVFSLHMFSTDLAIDPATAAEAGFPMESDYLAFQTVAGFSQDLLQVRQWLADAGRADASVWVTGNQVNSDTPSSDGSDGHLSQRAPQYIPFVADSRGTDAFFTAWRPYVFSQLGKAGNQELFQWQYTAGRCPNAAAGCSLLDGSDTDRQNAEVDYVSGAKYLSYWVDQALGLKFPPGGDILQVDVTTPSDAEYDVEALATRSSDTTGDRVVVMVVNWTPLSHQDIDGPGAPRNVVVDLTDVIAGAGFSPTSWSLSELVIDGSTGPAGPTEQSVPIQSLQLGPNWALPIEFTGYGVVFVTMTRPSGG